MHNLGLLIMPGMLKSRDRSRSRNVSRPIFDGLGLGLEGSGLGLGLGLEGSGLVNIPGLCQRRQADSLKLSWCFAASLSVCCFAACML